MTEELLVVGEHELWGLYWCRAHKRWIGKCLQDEVRARTENRSLYEKMAELMTYKPSMFKPRRKGR